MILVLITNLLIGCGFLLLGIKVLQQPQRLWVGIRVPRTPEEVARVRRLNLRLAPWLLIFGAADVLSGPVGLLLGIDPLLLAAAGLVILLLAIISQAVVYITSR